MTGVVQDSPELDRSVVANRHLCVLEEEDPIFVTTDAMFSSALFAYSNPTTKRPGSITSAAPTSNSHAQISQRGAAFFAMAFLVALW